MRRSSSLATLFMACGLLAAVAASAITHTSDYKTNMGNYRTCTEPPLDSCDFAETLSPSKFYLPAGTTTTVIHKDDGAVQLRIDAGGILTDDGISYSCVDETFPCVGGLCQWSRATTGCTVNRCIGGTNDGGVCATGSACPGGACTGGASCVMPTCHGGGPRDHKECGGTQPACTSVASTNGWSVVFRGNLASWAYHDPTWNFHLRGDGESGCIKACTFGLGTTGAINSSALSCSTTGTCGGIEAFHYVELRDPDGQILAVPTVGAAQVVNGLVAVEGDPARVGDCSRPSNAAFCP